MIEGRCGPAILLSSDGVSYTAWGSGFPGSRRSPVWMDGGSWTSARAIAPTVMRRICIQGNVEALPFKDKSFDYAYACHVLEHVTDPERACSEAMLVARSGYIETPDPFYDQEDNYPDLERRGWSYHRWLVWVNEAGTLIFGSKNEETLRTFCGCRYANFVGKIYQFVESGKRDEQQGLNRIHNVLPNQCNYTQLYWMDRFNFVVRRLLLPERSSDSPVQG